MRIRLFVSCVAAAVAISPALAVPALASYAGHTAAGERGAPSARGAQVSVLAKKSAVFAGYKVHAKRGDTSVTATIVVPKLKCTKGRRAIAASAGLYEDSKTKLSSASLFIGCVNGKAHYFPSLTVNRHRSNLTSTAAHPGDMVTLQVSASTVETVVEITDATHSFDKSRIGAPYSNFVANPWVGDMKWSTSQGFEGVPRFGTITFSTATIDGNPFGSFTPLVRFNMYNKAKTTLQIKTRKLATTGDSFETVFKHS